MYKKWVKLWFVFGFIFIFLISLFNYVVDPYGIYDSKVFDFEKIRQDNKIRLVKAVKIEQIKPVSIVLGTSRADYGYNPDHPYFTKPAYNLAVSGASMYEMKIYFSKALEQGNLKKVLLVLDYFSFNHKKQKQVQDFETYFNNPNIYKYLLTVDQLKDSIFTVLGVNPTIPHLQNGMRKPGFGMEKIIKNGKYLQNFINNEKDYYKDNPTNYTYKDTGKNSFLDFEYVVKKCYENNITLDIIFGPSHIRQWESLAYFLGYDKWLKWKKDIVISVNKIAKKYNKRPFRIMDFAVYYDGITNEKIPTTPNKKMKYYRESSHYTVTLGNIVLDRLIGKSKYQNFGVELNLNNVDQHLKKLKEDRVKFINIQKHQKEVFGKVKKD